MKPRQTPLDIPNRAPYVRIEVGNHGEHVFRMPWFAQAARLQKLVSDEERDAYANAKTLTETTDAVAVIASKVCAVIGMLWHHPTLALEAENSGDLDAYGAAVAEELHEAGYGIIELITAWAALLNAMTRSMYTITKAEEEAKDFLPPGGDAQTQH